MRLRPSNQRSNSERGAAAVEFALILPVLLMLVFGIIQYGIYFWTMQGVSAAGRDAARSAAVGDFPQDCTAFRQDIKDAIAHLGDEDSLTSGDVTRTYTNGPGNTSADVEIGDQVEVRIVFTSLDMHLPFIPLPGDGVVTEVVESRVDYIQDPTVLPQECT